MQQLQQSIKKDLIKHPFRNIEIIYEADKTTLTEQDKDMIAAFIRLHDFELEMKNTSEGLYHESVSVNETITALHEELKKVQATFDACCTIADKLSEPSFVLEEASLEKLNEAREETQQALQNYHPKLLTIYETTKVQQEKMNQYNEANEDKSEALYDEFTILVTDHSVNWENNTIDIVAFDRQFDQFRDYRTMMESRREDLMNECELAMTNYTNLNNETTALYNLWNELVKRSDLLARISDLHTKATGFTEN